MRKIFFGQKTSHQNYKYRTTEVAKEMHTQQVEQVRSATANVYICLKYNVLHTIQNDSI